MRLTSWTYDEIPSSLDRYQKGLQCDPLSAHIFSKIAKSLDLIQNHDLSLTRDAQYYQKAYSLASLFSIGLRHQSEMKSVTWDGQSILATMEPSVIIHDISHYQLAPPNRRFLVDFGLGAGPETNNKERANGQKMVSFDEANEDEILASLLGIIWETHLGLPSIAAFLEQNWLEGGATELNFLHFIKTVQQLKKKNMIDDKGEPLLTLAQSSSQ
jgi:hypothetical protein